MATIKEEVEQAAIELNLGTFANWLTDPDETATELVAMLRPVSHEIMDRHAWSLAKKTVTTAVAAETSAIPLPADFSRLQRTEGALFEAAPMMREISFCQDDTRWNANLPITAPRIYRRASGGFEVRPALPAGALVNIAYVSKNWIIGGLSTWTNEATDEPIFPSILLCLGLKYRYLMAKGFAYADVRAEFTSTLARAMAEDAPRRSFGFGEPSRQPRGDFTVSVP